MLKIFFLQVFLLSILAQWLLCDDGQKNQQPNQNQNNQQPNQNNQNGGKTDDTKNNPKYTCSSYIEPTCIFKKIRLVLHKIRMFFTPSQWHLPAFHLTNPFGGSKPKDNNQQNGNPQNQNGS